MERISETPLAVYQEHLEKGELAYQWSPEASRAIFYPRVICPFTGSDQLEWRISAGLGTVYATTVTHPREVDRGRARRDRDGLGGGELLELAVDVLSWGPSPRTRHRLGE